VTCFAPDKTVQPRTVRFATLHGAWQALSRVQVRGYEIHQGQTAPHPALLAAGHVAHEVLPGLAWCNATGNVLGVYLHGLFENDDVLQALLGGTGVALDEVFERMAAGVGQWFASGFILP